MEQVVKFGRIMATNGRFANRCPQTAIPLGFCQLGSFRGTIGPTPVFACHPEGMLANVGVKDRRHFDAGVPTPKFANACSELSVSISGSTDTEDIRCSRGWIQRFAWRIRGETKANF
ncbi:hypothetical protein [Bradyrhizobium sp.]|uniref:hypothetical protein n=1 Tax=Bradyrhizobium sp. TaxID=376 RepID=UPI002BF6AEA2|nr:hypothetical protein [Bradyrhizobium sp.]HWX63372.1 hypothetical protein [Bradyrhizobium sp.]